MATFQLPDVGEGLTEAEIVRWLVEPGQHVDVNQMLCEIETAKALVELPSPFEGTVEELHAKPGDVVPVGGDLVTVQTREPVLVGYGTSEEKPVRRRRRTVGPPGAQTKPVRHGGFEVARSTEEKLAHQEPRARTKPPVRRLAKTLGVDLAAIDPTGPGGVVTRADVERAASQRTDSAQVIPVRGVMRTMARAMVESAFSAPHVTEWLDVEVSESMRFLDRLRDKHPDLKWSPTVLAAYALADAARRYPGINATFDASAEVVIRHADVGLGMAVATERGLLVPRVATGSLLDLAENIATVTEAARSGALQPADFSGTTISLTNVGVFGVDGGTPILPPGHVAILCLGRVVERAWVVDGAVVPRP
ncbi:MAG: dihydrolipoamide acetyltransferase family protein, partial [Candidatus Nanopelagicales bacterium]